jgi:hypothetical protein
VKVLLCTDDVLGPTMAGSALRCWEMARVLADAGHLVRVAAPARSTLPEEEPGVSLCRRPTWRWAEVTIAPPWSLPPAAFVLSRRLVADCVTPLLAELAAMPESRTIARRRITASSRLPLVAARADALLVAGRAQRGWWSRVLGRRRPDLPILDVPFGVSNTSPEVEPVQIPGVPRHHAVVLWWGGVWPWLDLETLVAARARIRGAPLTIAVPVGTRPGASTPVFGPSQLAALQEKYRMQAPAVVGIDRWVPYAKRHRVLQRASLLAVLHRAGQEAELSFRTRALDGLWAEVPLLLSEGGEVAELTRRHGWGGVVRPGDVRGTAAALELLLGEREQLRCRANLRKAAPHWTWRRLMDPLQDILPSLPEVPRSSLSGAAVDSALTLCGVNRFGGAL